MRGDETVNLTKIEKWDNEQALRVASRIMRAVEKGKYKKADNGDLYVKVWAMWGSGSWKRLEAWLWIAGYHVRPSTVMGDYFIRTYVLTPAHRSGQ